MRKFTLQYTGVHKSGLSPILRIHNLGRNCFLQSTVHLTHLFSLPSQFSNLQNKMKVCLEQLGKAADALLKVMAKRDVRFANIMAQNRCTRRLAAPQCHQQPHTESESDLHHFRKLHFRALDFEILVSSENEQKDLLLLLIRNWRHRVVASEFTTKQLNTEQSQT